MLVQAQSMVLGLIHLATTNKSLDKALYLYSLSSLFSYQQTASED